MHTERDVTRIVRSWLRLDEHVSADRVLDRVLARLDATPQRRSWWPARRITEMNTAARLAIAAIVVVVVAVGIGLLPGLGTMVGGPAVSPSPSSTPRVSPSSPPVGAYPHEGIIIGGTYSVIVDGVALSFDVPNYGWESHGGVYMSKSSVGPQGAEAVVFWTVVPGGAPYIPCTDLWGSPASPSLADLAAAVSTVPGTDVVSGPADVSVGGRAAKHVAIFVTYSVLDNASVCYPGFFYSWTPAGEEGAFWDGTLPGDTIRVWIVDVDEELLWIEAETHWNADPRLVQQIQQMIDSIRFE